MEIVIMPPVMEDLKEIELIERESFSTPWDITSLQKDMFENNLSIYVVAKVNNELVGYAGMWHVVTEGHITNIAVKKSYRRKGVAKEIVKSLIKIANEKEMMGLTLEVRESNVSAVNLYSIFDFQEEGRRKNYYDLPTEDAIIMWKYFDEYITE